MKEILGKISSVESMGLLDGPGIRYVVFMQGCLLRCVYCHNPETWSINGEQETITASNLVSKILRFKNYFSVDGGVTFSGGEPLLQPQFLIECLNLCKQNNINTALDTAGVGTGQYEEILDLVDLVILDVKATTDLEYKKITGQSMKKFNEFLNVLKTKNCKIWLRQVIVPNLNDNKESVIMLKEFAKSLLNVEKIELLPYKTLGASKYDKLNIKYKLTGVPQMEDKALQHLQKILN